ncbi:hypothetical protein [Dactylosporangium sp. CA-233914]|uniref:hypothetical protein n=1 Tax=Dactylosporangium sp. CA-233914 TaxID=3239934 RepID=UPI003D8CC3C9
MDGELLVGLASASRLTGTQDLALTYTVDIGGCEGAPSGLAYQTPDVMVVAAVRGGRASRECGGGTDAAAGHRSAWRTAGGCGGDRCGLRRATAPSRVAGGGEIRRAGTALASSTVNDSSGAG